MICCMRTTIRVDDQLLADAKAKAARTGRTLTEVIEDALRESLARHEGGPKEDHGPLPTFQGKGIQAGVDLDSSAAMLDLMDDRAAD
jgi:hypothetical protein